MDAHLPLLRRHGLVTARPGVSGIGKDGALVEVFEWESEEKSRSAPAFPEIGNHWKKMADAMDFVGLASLPETQTPFAHFMPL